MFSFQFSFGEWIEVGEQPGYDRPENGIRWEADDNETFNNGGGPGSASVDNEMDMLRISQLDGTGTSEVAGTAGPRRKICTKEQVVGQIPIATNKHRGAAINKQ